MLEKSEMYAACPWNGLSAAKQDLMYAGYYLTVGKWPLDNKTRNERDKLKCLV